MNPLQFSARLDSGHRRYEGMKIPSDRYQEFVIELDEGLGVNIVRKRYDDILEKREALPTILLAAVAKKY
jgi:hypothetical protein